MPAHVTVRFRRPRGCPRWLWAISASDARVVVGNQRAKVRWGDAVELPVDATGARIHVSYDSTGPYSWFRVYAAGFARPGDHFTFRGLWFAMPRRRLKLAPD